MSAVFKEPRPRLRPRIIHVYPVRDERDHFLEDAVCWCHPRMEHELNGGQIWFHHKCEC